MKVAINTVADLNLLFDRFLLLCQKSNLGETTFSHSCCSPSDVFSEHSPNRLTLAWLPWPYSSSFYFLAFLLCTQWELFPACAPLWSCLSGGQAHVRPAAPCAGAVQAQALSMRLKGCKLCAYWRLHSPFHGEAARCLSTNRTFSWFLSW